MPMPSFCAWDSDGTVTYFNEYAERFFGYSAAEILGRHVVGTIVPPARVDHWRDLARDGCRDPGRSGEVRGPTRTRTSRGTAGACSCAGPIGSSLDEHDKPVGVLCIGQDITEKWQADRELELHRYHLEELVQRAHRGALRCQGSGRGGQPGQDRLSRQHEPRAAHADERHHGHDRPGPARGHRPEAGRSVGQGRAGRPASARYDQRYPGHLRTSRPNASTWSRSISNWTACSTISAPWWAQRRPPRD